jgi:hypothetical protein
MPKTKKTEAPKATKESPTIAEIVAQIKADQDAILAEETSMTANEARIVLSKLEIGRQLVALKAAARQAKKKWLTCVEFTGIHKRVARRFVRVAKSKWAEKGPNGSLPDPSKLPTDLHKLDALTKLSREQLDRLLAEKDLKRLERDEVIALARAARGDSPKTEAAPAKKLEDSARRFRNNSVKTIRQMKEPGLTPEAREQVLKAMGDTFDGIRRALQGDGVDEIKPAQEGAHGVEEIKRDSQDDGVEEIKPAQEGAHGDVTADTDTATE